nr:hypothetical protein [Tanacetum cinerariifolium]
LGISRRFAILYFCTSSEHGWPAASSSAGLKNVNYPSTDPSVVVAVAFKVLSHRVAGCSKFVQHFYYDMILYTLPKH